MDVQPTNEMSMAEIIGLDVSMTDDALEKAYNDAWARHFAGDFEAIRQVVAYGGEKRRRFSAYLDSLGDVIPF